MSLRYEVTWDTDLDDPMNEGEKCKNLKLFLDIAEARQCMLVYHKRNAVMRVIKI